MRSWTAFTNATLAEAIAAAAEAPAQAIGLPAPLTQGARADLVLTDDAGAVLRAMRHGDWVT